MSGPFPTFADRVAALTVELEQTAATAQHRAEQRRSEGRPLSRAWRDRLVALASSTRALADALAALSYEPDPSDRPRSPRSEIEEAARAGGYNLDA